MTGEAGWFPVGLAADLEPSTSFGTRLFGRELVVWRDDAGQSHVWEDRCPHRGMRLSFGFVRGSHIACLYHGWQFDAGGRCRFIPAHPALDPPASITVDRFASAERLGIVWVAFDGAGAGPPPGGNASATAVRSIAIAASADRVMAGLRDSQMPFAGDRALDIGTDGALMSVSAGEDRFYAALQPISGRETTLHLVTEAGSALDPREVSRWAERLRRAVEAKTTTTELVA